MPATKRLHMIARIADPSHSGLTIFVLYKKTFMDWDDAKYFYRWVLGDLPHDMVKVILQFVDWRYFDYGRECFRISDIVKSVQYINVFPLQNEVEGLFFRMQSRENMALSQMGRTTIENLLSCTIQMYVTLPSTNLFEIAPVPYANERPLWRERRRRLNKLTISDLIAFSKRLQIPWKYNRERMINYILWVLANCTRRVHVNIYSRPILPAFINSEPLIHCRNITWYPSQTILDFAFDLRERLIEAYQEARAFAHDLYTRYHLYDIRYL